MDINLNKKELHLYRINAKQYIGAIDVEAVKATDIIQTVFVLDASLTAGNGIERFVDQILPLVVSKLGYSGSFPIHVIFFGSKSIYIKTTVAELPTLLKRFDVRRGFDGSVFFGQAIEKLLMILADIQRSGVHTPIRVLTVTNGRYFRDVETELKKLSDFLATSDLTINSQTVKQLPSSHLVKQFYYLLQMNNTTETKCINVDINAASQTSRYTDIAQEIAALFTSDGFERCQTLQFEKSIILKLPWKSSPSQRIILPPGRNVFWLTEVPAGTVKLGSDTINIIERGQLTLRLFYQLIETKLYHIVDHIKNLRIVDSTETNRIVDQIVAYFEKIEEEIAVNGSVPNTKFVTTLLDGIGRKLISNYEDSSKITQMIRNTIGEFSTQRNKEDLREREGERERRKREEDVERRKREVEEELERRKREVEEEVERHKRELEEEERHKREEEEQRRKIEEEEARRKREVEEEERRKREEKEHRRQREEEDHRQRLKREEEERHRRENEERYQIEDAARHQLEEERRAKFEMLEEGKLSEQIYTGTVGTQNKLEAEFPNGLQRINEKQEFTKVNNWADQNDGSKGIFTKEWHHLPESRKTKTSLIRTAANKLRQFTGAIGNCRGNNDTNPNPIQTVFVLDENTPTAKKSWRFTEKIIPLVFSKISYEKSQLVHLLTVYRDTTPVVQMLQSLLQTLDASKRIRIFVLTIVKPEDEHQQIEHFAETLIKFLNGSNFVYELQVVRLAPHSQQSLLSIKNGKTKYQLIDIEAKKSNAFVASRILELFNSGAFQTHGQVPTVGARRNFVAQAQPAALVSLEVDGKQLDGVRTSNCDFCRDNVRKYRCSYYCIFLVIFAIPIMLLLFDIYICYRNKK